MRELFENQYSPDLVSPPGETLDEVLLERGMSQAELADRTGRPKKTINEIVRGKAAITVETALQFERVLGIPANFWIAREQQYRESLARQKELMLFEDQSDWLSSMPVRAMVRLGWIQEFREKSRQVGEVLRFFGVASPESWEGIWQQDIAFRKSPSFVSDPGATAAWLRKGEIEATSLEVQPYNAEQFRTVLQRIRSLTRESYRSVNSRLQTECASAGVCLVFVPEVQGTRVWGVTRWLSTGRPLLQLSGRYQTDDHFWFTLFHEAGHILLHSRRELFLEEEEQDENEKEAEANAFARELLIPENRYRGFRRLGSHNCAAVSRFAYELGIAAGIVVGCLQHDGILDRKECNNLKKRVPIFEDK
jgi:HTH-type transcriptional regulator/antitoxin HigA